MEMKVDKLIGNKNHLEGGKNNVKVEKMKSWLCERQASRSHLLEQARRDHLDSETQRLFCGQRDQRNKADI